MNSTVISGTPRTNSMKITENSFTAGIFERRPSASRMPMGSDTTMPTHATTMVTSSPPQSEVSTRRIELQEPDDAHRQHCEEDIDPPALGQRIRAVDEIGDAVAHERPARADLESRRRL